MEHVHLIGIGGSGLSAIARVLLESGVPVSGSDRQPSPLSRSLEETGVRVYYGHRPENIKGASLIIRSSAVQDDNVEVQAARAAGVPVLKRADFLGRLMEGRLGIAVAGTHGKTTTTAMIAWLLSTLEQDPSFIIGGVSKNLGTNARAGRGKAFVIEADEYDWMFLGLKPAIAVVTNVQHDHPDCYPTVEDYQAAFLSFAGLLGPDDLLLACGDDPGAACLGRAVAEQGSRVRYYGLDAKEVDYRADGLIPNDSGGFTFTVTVNQAEPALPSSTCSLQVPGIHNVLNALAALGTAHQVGLPLERAAQALGEFQGTGRRFDLLGEVRGVTIIDDYAHHPAEIRATLSAARARYPARTLWAVWQPHTYSRTRVLLEEFASAFQDADHVLITEIYGARETAPADFSTRQVVEAMRHPDVRQVESFELAVELLTTHLQPGDVLLVLSAGDADQISRSVLETFERSRNRAGRQQ